MTNEKSTENVELLGNNFHTVTDIEMFKSKIDRIKLIEKKKSGIQIIHYHYRENFQLILSKIDNFKKVDF